MLAQVDRLGPLQMGVAGHRPVEVACGEVERGAREFGRSIARERGPVPDEHRDVGRDLVVARTRGMELAAGLARDLGHPPLDCHVDVLVAVRDFE